MDVTDLNSVQLEHLIASRIRTDSYRRIELEALKKRLEDMKYEKKRKRQNITAEPRASCANCQSSKVVCEGSDDYACSRCCQYRWKCEFAATLSTQEPLTTTAGRDNNQNQPTGCSNCVLDSIVCRKTKDGCIHCDQHSWECKVAGNGSQSVVEHNDVIELESDDEMDAATETPGALKEILASWPAVQESTENILGRLKILEGRMDNAMNIVGAMSAENHSYSSR